jgi:D-sedoheptulose 7-phosphate isomerase
MTLAKLLNEDVNLTKKIIKLEAKINKVISIATSVIKSKNKIFICGNGGSAADAEHLAAEFFVRLRPKVNRRPYPVISLAQNVPVITACSNDYGFKYLFRRNLQAMATKEDLLICLSTSGNSQNIKEVLKFAKKIGVTSISFLGKKTKTKCHGLADLELCIPSSKVAKIQECQLMLGHYIFEQVENNLINEDFK